MKIPSQGRAADAVLDTLESFRAHDLAWRDGRTWAYIYDAGEGVEALAKRAFAAYLSENALDPTSFPSLMRLENEVLAMAMDHLSAPPDAAGSFTSGGTESIILAVKTARDFARAQRPELQGRLEIVLPVTAHAAFHKAAHYLDLEVVAVPVRPDDFRADVDAMAAAITERTVLLVGSAPGYTHGVVDPIEALGQLAIERDVWLHVDGCIGGFILPYLRRLGAEVPAFDFTVPGVRSISMDLHKYAYCPKGASVLVHRDRVQRRHQIYTCASWSGYTVVNPTVQSTKSGGPVAAAWAVLQHVGDDGYLELARQSLEATKAVREGIARIDGLSVLGEPHMNLIALVCTRGSPFRLADAMKARGWYLQPQLSFQSTPANLHLSVNPNNARWVEALLADLEACVEEIAGLPPSPLAGAAAELAASMGPDQLDEAAVARLLELAGAPPGGMPSGMADVNEALDALPPALRERLVTVFVNLLYAAPRAEAG